MSEEVGEVLVTTAATQVEAYCGSGWLEFRSMYSSVHGYIALLVCLLGCAANSVNIAVLSRKEMISSTNTILTGLAVADLLVMIEYIPFALHIYIKIFPDLNKNSYGWAVFVYFHSIFSQTFHTISIWLTITLAVWRFIAIKFPQKNRTLCNKQNTNIAIGIAYAVCPILCFPIYFAMNIQEVFQRQGSMNSTVNETDSVNASVAYEPVYQLSMTENKDLLTAIFWIYSVFIKLIPCVVLSILSVLLILKMKSSDRRRQKLLKKSAITATEGEKKRLNEDGKRGGGGGGGRTDRTTRMLVALLGLFLATELPQALFGLLTAIAPQLFGTCYYSLGEVMDMMALVGSAVNFVLYCSMSRQFRSTFTRLARKVLPLLGEGGARDPADHTTATLETKA